MKGIFILLLVGLSLAQPFEDSTDEELTKTDSYSFKSKHFAIKVEKTKKDTFFYVKKFDREMQRVRLDKDFDKFKITKKKDGFVLHGKKQDLKFDVLENDSDFSLIKVSRKLKTKQKVSDCFELDTGRTHWFGGPQIFYQYWPVEKLVLKDYSYVAKQKDNVGVAERYWLQSKGAFVYVDDKVPLFLDQNVKGNTMCFKAENKLPYNTRRKTMDFVYFMGFAADAKKAHKKAVKKFLKKPKGMIDRRMVEHPIWSTWARYKRYINDSTVDEFVPEILKYDFENSQLEIDDDWEICYGALEFRDSKFKDIKKETEVLKSRGFRVTLWIHPFINKGCEPWYSEAKEKGYLVTDYDGKTDTEWWNSEKDEAAYIDFTNKNAAKWYLDRLKKLQKESGIDSFKSDAGETSWLPKDPKLSAPLEDHPNAIIKEYIRTVAKFGPMVEVRSAFKTQDLPIFLRMLDKDSEWTFKNGLPTLITTLLQLNMVGYGFILPDMIGGNGYNGKPSKELFIRWLQANVFMPSLQFSYVPWDYDEETIEISKKFTKLHADFTDDIMKAMKKNVETGELVNAPIWWLDPHDETALSISDEFLLGDRILAAPVIKKDDEYRHIYLPKGNWYDPNKDKMFKGPIWLMDYPAPLDVLPYFMLKD